MEHSESQGINLQFMNCELHKPKVKTEEIPSKHSLANTFSGVCEYIFVNAKTMTKMADILMIGKVALCNDLLYR